MTSERFDPAVILYDEDGNVVDTATTPYGNNALQVNTTSRGAPELDAFGRRRVSQPTTLFDSKFAFDERNVSYEDSTTGGGSVTYAGSTGAKFTLGVSSSGDVARKSSIAYWNYQPGKSQLSFITFRFPDTSDVVRRVGLFDDNNGIFLEQNNGALTMKVRSSATGSVVEAAAAQASWNIETLDGSGTGNNNAIDRNGSALQLDQTKAHILIIDYEWLGVGTVRVGFVINGSIYYVHSFDHSNIATGVYMNTPNLPVAWEIEGNSTGSRELDAICSTVISEGGIDDTGAQQVAWRRTSESIGTTPEALISIRVRPTGLGNQNPPVFPRGIGVVSTSGANFQWYLVYNPTISGGVAANWVDIDNSYCQYDETRSGTWDQASGYVVATGFGSNNLDIAQLSTKNLRPLGQNEESVLIVRTLNNTETFYGSLTWLEG